MLGPCRPDVHGDACKILNFSRVNVHFDSRVKDVPVLPTNSQLFVSFGQNWINVSLSAMS